MIDPLILDATSGPWESVLASALLWALSVGAAWRLLARALSG